MLNDASRNTFKKVYIACEFTDLRYGLTGLATLVKCRYHLDPYDKGTLFIFCGRRTDRIKAFVGRGRFPFDVKVPLRWSFPMAQG